MKKLHDHYFIKAKDEGYAARSVYKLKEANEKYGFIKQGYAVLDLGASPGSWTKYAMEQTGANGRVVAVDINPLKNQGNCLFLQKSVFEVTSDEICQGVARFDVVLSDMAPKTTGAKDVDHLRSIALCECALELAKKVLKGSGVFFCKIFQGRDMDAFVRQCKESFKEVRLFKPKSSRSESVEIFVFAKGLLAS